MEKNTKNVSPVGSSRSSPKPQKNINLLFAQDTFDLNQIQSATSVNLQRDIHSSPNTSDSSAIRKIFELNSRIYLQDNQSQDVKKPPTDSPKNSYFKLIKRLQKKNSADTLTSQPAVPLKIPISPKNDEEDSENASNPFVTPASNASKTRSLLNFITKKIKPQLFTLGRDQEEDDMEDFGFELENVLIEFPAGIISPYGYFKKCWDLLMAAMLVYISIALPVRLCFSREPTMFEKNRATDFEDDWLIVDIIIDVILVFDIIINFLSAYENVAGILFSKRTDIAKKYVTGWFFVDLVSAFPINRNIFALPHINFEDREFNFENYVAWRIIRFIKLIRVVKIFDTIEHLFSLMTLNVDKIKIIKFTTFILVFIHITGCIWNAVAELQLGDTWMDLEPNYDTTVSEKYGTAVYFALTVLLTVGYGNIHPTNTLERLISVIWMFFGIIVYTYIFSALTISMAKLNQMKSAEEEKDMFYRQWTYIFKLPYETLDLILATIGGDNSTRSARKMEVINHATKVLEDLPKGLYIDIYNYIFKELIEKVEFFRNRPRLFVIKLIPLLKQTNFEKGDFIYASGDPAMEVFFIVRGRVLSKCQDKFGKERLQVFVEGSFFGEVDIILKRNRTATLRAEDHCELWKINKKEFLGLLNEFPAIKEEVEKLAKIKEIFRTPITELSPENGTEQLVILENITGDHLYGGSKIFNALSNKMIKKIKKGRYFNSNLNKNTYESLDFEPDLPSPDAITGSVLEILERGDEEKEDEILQKEEEPADKDKKASSLIDLDKGKEDNAIQNVVPQKRRSLNEGVVGFRKDLFQPSGNKPTKVKRSLVQWEINFQAKKRLLEELKLKGIEINDTSEIDKILQKDETLAKVKETATIKCEQVEEVGEQMIRQVEGMLVALEQYEDGVDQMIEYYISQKR